VRGCRRFCYEKMRMSVPDRIELLVLIPARADEVID